jgi:hypothetical protein
MCNCIKEIEAKLKHELGAYDVMFEHFGHQGSEVRIRPYRKDGKVSKCNQYETVNWRFCPFCGEKL